MTDKFELPVYQEDQPTGDLSDERTEEDADQEDLETVLKIFRNVN